MHSLARIGLLLLFLGGVAGCGWFHDDDDVVISGEVLVPKDGGCVVQGTIRNEARERVRANLVWTALKADGDEIGAADAEIRNLARDETRSFESSRFREFDGDLIDCSRIARTRRNEVVVDD